jgi:4-hydroxythreonine-4-phosphate dehydrogenase
MDKQKQEHPKAHHKVPTDKEKRVRVGISHGDINGIGYEIILRTLQDQRLLDHATVIVYGSSKVASFYKKLLDITDVNFQIIKNPEQAQPKKPNMVNITEEEIKVEVGKTTKTGGEMAYKSLEMAMEDLQKGKIDVLVTAPISKNNIQSEAFNFPGHTEYLAARCGVEDSLMLMVHNRFRIGVVTGHIPIAEVPGAITEEVLLRKIRMMDKSLREDFGIVKPRIALLALNPHAGDDGLIGDEDQRVIQPAIKKAFEEKILAFGPYPADGLFGSSNFRTFDGILAMYHDQGMIPFKLLSWGEGVNFTAGLPVIRTSPAHGTAFDIAGEKQGRPEAFRNALFLGVDLFQNRKQFVDLKEGAIDPEELKKIDPCNGNGKNHNHKSGPHHNGNTRNGEGQ